jgi:NADP-dependent 3-hydroxy acid dehydrogenase YdfG
MGSAPQNPRSILITGASSGVGEAMAKSFAAPGVFLALTGRARDRLESVAATCRDLGAEVEAEAIDVTDRPAMEAWIPRIDDRHPIDLVFANAGVSSGTLGEDKDDIHRMFAINVTGVLNTVLPLIPRFQARRSGQIALMASLAGVRGLPTAPAYAATKNAVRAWGEGLRPRLARDGVKVSVITPGFITTRLTAANPFPMPMIMPVDKAVRIIRHGLARNKGRIAFPWSLAAVSHLATMLPNALVDRFLMDFPFKE